MDLLVIGSVGFKAYGYDLQPGGAAFDDEAAGRVAKHHFVRPFTAAEPDRLAAGQLLLAPGQVNRAAADGRKDQCRRGRVTVVLPPGRFHHGFLDQVLRVRIRARLLPGKEQELRRVVFQPAPPIGLLWQFIHSTGSPASILSSVAAGGSCLNNL